MNTHYDNDILIDYLHGALEPAIDARVFAHLEICSACRTVRDEESAIGESLRRTARAAELEFPSMVKARVWDAVRHQPPTILERLRTRWGPAIAVPVAAVLALAAYLGMPVLRGQNNPPGIAASYYLDVHNAEAAQNPLGPSVGPAVYTNDSTLSAASSYIDTADAATLDTASGAIR
jgi:putative zinc finger protein